MKLWRGFGSEHSANLFMIGHFSTPEDAQVAVKELERMRALIEEEFDYDQFLENSMSFYTNDSLRKMLEELGLYNFSGEDIEHFTREHRVRRSENRVEIWTDELDVNGFLKFMIDKGVHVEVYSAHNFPDVPPTQT